MYHLNGTMLIAATSGFNYRAYSLDRPIRP